jgi:hypothetical protein
VSENRDPARFAPSRTGESEDGMGWDGTGLSGLVSHSKGCQAKSGEVSVGSLTDAPPSARIVVFY